MSDPIASLDIRDELRRGREPFPRIMTAVGALRPGDKLAVVAPFEPTPLMAVLSQQGFVHQSRRLPSGDWEVIVARPPGAASQFIAPDRPPCAAAKPAPTETREVDARGLEPPQPLIAILEALGTLPAGAELRARTERKPMHLYAQLDERGFIGETKEQPDGTYLTHIRRR